MRKSFIYKHWLAGLLCVFYSSLLVADDHPSNDDERLLKTAYVFNFAKFTRWPEAPQASTNQPLILCSIGKDELSSGLKNLQDKIIKNRPVKTRSLDNIEQAKDCQVLYIATNSQTYYKKIISQVHELPILTISQASYFARNGGIIQFYRKKAKTRIIINLNAAHMAELEISSRLLILADIIGAHH